MTLQQLGVQRRFLIHPARQRIVSLQPPILRTAVIAIIGEVTGESLVIAAVAAQRAEAPVSPRQAIVQGAAFIALPGGARMLRAIDR